MKTTIAALSTALLLATTAQAEEAVISLQNIEPESVVASLKKLKTPTGEVLTTPGSNKIVIMDAPESIAKMQRYVAAVDTVKKQVMIEARIIESSDDFSRSLGISWKLITDRYSDGKDWPFISLAASTFGGITATPGTSTIGSTTGAADILFGTIGANVRLGMRINAAESEGMIKVISSPRVIAQSGKVAKITQGKLIPYISSTSDKVETKFVEASLALEVVPFVRDDGKIYLSIEAKNDAPDTTSTSSTPPINIKRATTDVTITEGQTVVIGGINIDNEINGSEGVPWLMDIPGLGHLFKSSRKWKGKSELLVMITPRIMAE